MPELLIHLLLAHFLGDFLLQPNRWVKDKLKRKLKSPYLYAHLAIHALLLSACLYPHGNYWLGLLIVLSSHFVLDASKLLLSDKVSAKLLFFLDQAAHLAVIAAVTQAYQPFLHLLKQFLTTPLLLLGLSLLFCAQVAAIIIKHLLSRWQEDIAPIQPSVNLSDHSLSPQIRQAQQEAASEGKMLRDAGIYIGMLERLFVFFFVVSGQFAGIGFLIAAKSVFRFGDLSNEKNRKLTEYVLIGTLLSFGFAVATAKLYLYALTLI